MFPLILQAHKLFIVTHHTTITPFLVSLNERESRGGQTVCLSVHIFVKEFVSPTRFVSRFVSRSSMRASESLLHGGPFSQTLLQYLSTHNPSESRFSTRSTTLTTYQNDRLLLIWYAISQTLDSNLPNHFHMFNTYIPTHVLPHQPSHVLTIFNCKRDHVIEVIVGSCFILNDVPASKIQVNEVFNACWPAHISPTKTPTRFNQVWFGSSFKET